jgi:hypothetical protein
VSAIALKGNACSAARVTVADWGAWYADLTLTDPIAFVVGDPAPIQCADLSLTGTIISGGVVDGRAAYRVVGGKGGWSKPLPSKPYANDAGVRAALVLNDAAAAVGETLDTPPPTRLGSHYARAQGLASACLNTLAPRAWRVDFDGVTRFGLRPPTPYTGSAVLLKPDPARGVYQFAAESLAGLLPGVTINGSLPATDIEYSLSKDRITVTVWAGSNQSRRRRAIAALVSGLFPNMRYQGAFEFRVISQEGERLNVQPVRSASGLPTLERVPVRAGLAGLKCKPVPGTLVVVQFLDADPSRPVVTGFDDPDSPGWMPLEITLGGPGALGVARIGDTVQAGPYAGVITSGSARVKAVL